MWAGTSGELETAIKQLALKLINDQARECRCQWCLEPWGSSGGSGNQKGFLSCRLAHHDY